MTTFRIGYRIDGVRQTQIVEAHDVSAAVDKVGVYRMGGAKLSSVSIQCSGESKHGGRCQRFTGADFCCPAHEPKATPDVVYVRSLADNAVVSSIAITNPTRRKVERVVRGLLINMDTARFYVDDHEFDDLPEDG